MAGIGSGNWIRMNKKTTVEECLILDINVLAQQGLLNPNSYAVISWRQGFTDKRLGCIALFTDRDQRILRLSYRWNNSVDISTRVRLQTTNPHFGGVRWWMTCPMHTDDSICNRRVGKLYLHEKHFACRHCHDLTYQSTRESHQRERLMKKIGMFEAIQATQRLS